jgi:lipopolysaccharide/colanic/teichoic acid biosynthesis glycosyltransferase
MDTAVASTRAMRTERTLPLERALNRAVKRATDQVLGLGALLVAAPVMAAVAILVKITSSGPVIYRRRVVGRQGVEFDAFKFRTMIADAEEALERNPRLKRAFEANYKLHSDPRVTGVGRVLRKFSIDELPQLINVLKGQMSIVGPRMLSPEEVTRFGEHISTVLAVRPGLTGSWQVSGRHRTSYARRIELDVEYVERWSLLCDLQILLRTPLVVLKGTGV